MNRPSSGLVMIPIMARADQVPGADRSGGSRRLDSSPALATMTAIGGITMATTEITTAALRSETGVPGAESSRSTLLVAPGRRYRHQEDGFIRGCDGDRSWQELKDDRGWMAELSGDPRPPLRTLLRPSWLLTGFTLEILGPVTACGREALRVGRARVV